MSNHASWVHGNALVLENPEYVARVGHYGWGADMQVKPGKGAWFHVALPTPVIVGDVRARLLRVFLLFDAEVGSIRQVTVWDGSSPIQEFTDLFATGEHRRGPDRANTFNLTNPHSVAFGVGISFYFVASIGFDSLIPPSRLIVGSAGADYST